MSDCACLLVKTIQLYMILCIMILFAIDTIDLMYSFFLAIDAVVDNDRLFLLLL